MSEKLNPVDAQLRDEFQLRNGVGHVAIRALSRLLGVAHTSIVRGGAIASSELGRSLAAIGFSAGAIGEWPETGVPDKACAVIAEHFAHNARNTTQQARDFLKLTSAMGVRAWIKSKCQGFDPAHQRLIPIAKQARKDFTQVLQDHGCDRDHFITITDNNNVLITGKRAYQLKKERAPEVNPKAISGRTLMTFQEREQTMALEVMEKAQVAMHNPSSGNDCISICSATAAAFKRLLTEPLEGALPCQPLKQALRLSVSPYEPFRPEVDF